MVFALGVLFCWFGHRLPAQTNSHGAADPSISGTLKLNDSEAVSAGDQVDLARVAHDIKRSLMRPGWAASSKNRIRPVRTALSGVRPQTVVIPRSHERSAP
jgi:hypothetical protein